MGLIELCEKFSGGIDDTLDKLPGMKRFSPLYALLPLIFTLWFQATSINCRIKQEIDFLEGTDFARKAIVNGSHLYEFREDNGEPSLIIERRYLNFLKRHQPIITDYTPGQKDFEKKLKAIVNGKLKISKQQKPKLLHLKLKSLIQPSDVSLIFLY